MVNRYGVQYDASSRDGNFDISDDEIELLDNLLDSIRSALYQLNNEAKEGNGCSIYSLRWKKRRWDVLQSVSYIDREISEVLRRTRDMWFDGEEPEFSENGKCSHFSNYYSNGKLFNGSVFYEDSEDDE